MRITVLDNTKFKLYEVADEQLAVNITRGYRPIDAGENIKLYCMDAQIPNIPIKGVCSEY